MQKKSFKFLKLLSIVVFFTSNLLSASEQDSPLLKCQDFCISNFGICYSSCKDVKSDSCLAECSTKFYGCQHSCYPCQDLCLISFDTCHNSCKGPKPDACLAGCSQSFYGCENSCYPNHPHK